GYGAITPLGHDVESYYHSLLHGESAVGFLEPELGVDGMRWLGSIIRDFDPKQHVQPRKTIKVLCREIQLGFGAAMQACKMANIEAGTVDPNRLGTVFSGEVIFSEIVDIESIVRLCAANGQMNHGLWATEAIENMYPLWMLKALPNMAACHVGIALDARGPNNTITTLGTSGLNAVLEAINVIRRGKADVMVIGSAASQNTFSRMLQRYEEDYSKAYNNPSTACKPFDRDRDGSVSGESASSVILERRSHAEARGATVLGAVTAWANTFGKSVNGRWSGTQNSTERTLSYLIERSGLGINDIDHVNACANGSIACDAGESRGIANILRDVPVVSYKGAIGDSVSGSGLVEWIASLAGMKAGAIPPTPNHESTAADCPVNVISKTSKPLTAPHAIKLSQTHQGHCVGIVFSGVAAPTADH
ncbi:MAG TPA: beta-ketoacyl synthase N-terminal-like domain-containing protein, partial [Pirellula sp.]|nr:beta-ketoacyl synthase N-terminal-like domain-containing protein [Pirellula sp.]